MRLLATAMYVVLLLASAGAFAVNVYLTGPTRAQTAADVELAYQLTQWMPRIALATLGIGIVFGIAMWRRGAGPIMKLAIVIACAVLGGVTWLSRQTMAELRFAVLPEVVRIPVADSSHVLSNDLVLGVSHAGEAVAYPVPIVAYHHIVNDSLAGEPYVVTY